MTATSGPARRAALEAWVAKRGKAARADLKQWVIAVDHFRGFAPGGGRAFACPKGQAVRANDPVAIKYPEKFRSFSEAEIEREVRGVVIRARSAVGL
jgi:hypothetical protein